LKEIARIRRMERGTLCRMRAGRYYNHQTWKNGRNQVRYVPRAQVAPLQTAINEYHRFLRLTQAYADLIIQRTRLAQAPAVPSSGRQPKSRK